MKSELPSTAFSGILGQEFRRYSEETEQQLTAETERQANHEVFFVAQQAVRETYEQEVLAPRQRIWDETAQELATAPVISWYIIDKHPSKKVLIEGNVQVNWGFECISDDDHMFTTKISATLLLPSEDFIALHRAKAHMHRQEMGLYEPPKFCPPNILGLAAEQKRGRRFYRPEVLKPHITSYLQEQTFEATSLTARITHTILGADKSPQVMEAIMVRQNAFDVCGQAPGLDATEAVADQQLAQLASTELTVEALAAQLESQLPTQTGEAFDIFKDILGLLRESTPKVVE
jgi:hypothetical protein